MIPLQASISHSRQFVVWAPEREEGTFWASWCEDAAQEISYLLGRPLPQIPSAPIYVHLLPGPRAIGRPVETVQGYPDSRLQQFVLVDLARYSESDLLEGLSRLICDRYAIARQSSSRRAERLASVPGWLAYGAALNIPASQRAHLRSLAAGLWRRGEFPSAEQCLGMHPSLLGRVGPRQEAFLYAFLRWLLGLPDFDSVLDMAIEKGVRGESVTRLDLLQASDEFQSLRDIELSWEMSLARMEKIDALASRSDPVAALLEVEKFIDSIFDTYSSLTGLQLGTANIARYREADWCRDLCREAQAGLQELSINHDQRLRSLVQTYIEAFRRLSNPAGGPLRKIVRGRNDSEIFAEAEQQRAALGEFYGRCKSYLDRVEDNLYNRYDAGGYVPGAEEIEYLDRVEKNLLPGRE